MFSISILQIRKQKNREVKLAVQEHSLWSHWAGMWTQILYDFYCLWEVAMQWIKVEKTSSHILTFIQSEIKHSIFEKFRIVMTFHECLHSLALLFFINKKEEEPAMQV